MNKLFIVANLKSYKTESEANDWLNSTKKLLEETDLNKKEIIICPSFTLLPIFHKFIKENNLAIKLGAQNISPFDEGAYTGEINAKQIKEFADYVLIGHSERRDNFKEDDEMLSKKTQQSLKYGLIPIFLIQSLDSLIPQWAEIIAYEPIFAIGSGNPDTPENANNIAEQIKQKGNYEVLYGGSVNSANINSFVSQPNLSGVLVGGASLEAEEFIKIIENV